MNTVKPDAAPLATQAINVYDRDGELIMLDFIVANQATTGDHQEPTWDTGVYNLADGTIVEHHQDHYYFWADRTDASVKNMEKRPATIRKEDFRFPGPTISMIKWPNSLTIQTAVIEAAEAQARRVMGMSPAPDPVLNVHTSNGMAPSLREAVRNAIREREFKVSQELEAELDWEMKLRADMALTKLPPEEFNRLVDEAVKRIQERDNPEEDAPATSKPDQRDLGPVHGYEERPIREGNWRSAIGADDQLFKIGLVEIREDLSVRIETEEYRRAPCGTRHLKKQDDRPPGVRVRPHQPTYKRELGWCDTCGEYGYFDKTPG